jgi:hypothetical protein
MGIGGSFPGGKAAGAWNWPLTPSSAEIKEWVELYLHSINTLSWRSVQLKHRDNFTFTFTLRKPSVRTARGPQISSVNIHCQSYFTITEDCLLYSSVATVETDFPRIHFNIFPPYALVFTWFLSSTHTFHHHHNHHLLLLFFFFFFFKNLASCSFPT